MSVVLKGVLFEKGIHGIKTNWKNGKAWTQQWGDRGGFHHLLLGRYSMFPDTQSASMGYSWKRRFQRNINTSINRWKTSPDADENRPEYPQQHPDNVVKTSSHHLPHHPHTHITYTIILVLNLQQNNSSPRVRNQTSLHFFFWCLVDCSRILCKCSPFMTLPSPLSRSEERRVGKECRL